MTESTNTTDPAGSHLCVLAEHDSRRYDLYRNGDAFLVRDAEGKASDREYESLPALLSGLQSVFLEFRLSGSTVKGFAELASAQEKAKSDVIDASRRIYAALDGVG